MILARAERLDIRLRSLLPYSSVVGPLFDVELLSSVVGLAPRVDSSLLDLEDRGFVYETRTIPSREYSFKHALTQLSIYEAIDPAGRRPRSLTYRYPPEIISASKLHGGSRA